MVTALRKYAIALKPMRNQRFIPVNSWSEAELRSRGYAESTNEALSWEANRVCPAEPSLSAMEMTVIEAFSIALSEIEPNHTIRVLDVGGFDGAYSNLIRSQFPKLIFEWTCVELQVVATHFSATNSRVKYSTDLKHSLQSKPDVIFASAFIQYLANPYEVLVDFFNSSKIVILNRLPLWPFPLDQPSVQTAQRKPFLIQYPAWFFSENQFLTRVAANADIVSEFEVALDRAYFQGQYRTYRGLVMRSKPDSGDE